MKKMRELSVIVPIYHTPPQLVRRCIESILCQGEVDLEVLLIFDGIDDLTNEILLWCVQRAVGRAAISKGSGLNGGEQAGEQASIRWEILPHQGVSAARNRGLTLAQGKWIFFLDADDYLEKGSLGEALRQLGDGSRQRAAENQKFDDEPSKETAFAPQVVVLDYCVERESTFLRGTTCQVRAAGTGLCQYESSAPCRIQHFVREVLRPQSGAGFVWGKLFRRGFLLREGLLFRTELILGEDAEFMVRVCGRAQEIWRLPILCCHHFLHPFSTVRRFHRDYAEQYLGTLQQIKVSLSETGQEEAGLAGYDTCVNYHLLLVMVNGVFHPDFTGDGRQRRQWFRQLLELPLFAQALRRIRWSDFTWTRRIGLACIKGHFFWGMWAIAGLRHMGIQGIYGKRRGVCEREE